MLGSENPGFARFTLYQAKLAPYHRQAETVSGRIRNRTASPRHRLPLSREPKTGENCQENLFEILFAANPFFFREIFSTPRPSLHLARQSTLPTHKNEE